MLTLFSCKLCGFWPGFGDSKLGSLTCVEQRSRCIYSITMRDLTTRVLVSLLITIPSVATKLTA